MEVKQSPYGSWKSPITAELIVKQVIGLSEIALDGDTIYWLEMRPQEGGRYTLVRRTPEGNIVDAVPASFNVRSRVHEYGGGSFVIDSGAIYFSNFFDQRIYVSGGDTPPQPLTFTEGMRYADGIIDQRRKRMICVREYHSRRENEIVNTLTAIALDGSGAEQILVKGNDFYSSPCLSPDGTTLAWLSWNHPHMPWDATTLWTAKVRDDGSLETFQMIAGGVGESIFQPQWSKEGILYFISDRTNWWNIYRWHRGKVEAITALEAEFGRPQWLFRMSTYAFMSENKVICSYTQNGIWHLGFIDIEEKKLNPIVTPYTEIGYLQASADGAVFIAGAPCQPLSVIKFTAASQKCEVLKRSSPIKIDDGYISSPQAIEFPTDDNTCAYAFYYAPQNRSYCAPPGELPPLLVISHGGPTSATSTAFNLNINYWTSRGIAVLDVNYGGSSGYGRVYRQRLNGAWGIVDYRDCINGGRYLIERGLADPKRLMIRGSSAGGYTTLCALTFSNFFRAGASHYGVSDLILLAEETHKFEAHYLDALVGPYPERVNIYRERSPINYVDRLACPVIFFQGLDDKIVPPNQAEKMVAALTAKGVPVAYIAFSGEQHGFRRGETIKQVLEAELYFYSQIFGFFLPEDVPHIPIANWRKQ